jgi:hypothetical protein
MWFRAQGKEVLLAVTIKPFLSYKRQDAAAIDQLREALKIYGAGGWKDTEDLRLGDRTQEAIRRAILEETGGLIWWGTRLVLSSRFVNEVEIPTAFSRKSAEPLYPVVPLFIDLEPGRDADREIIRRALLDYGDALLDCNGLVRRRSETNKEFGRRVARRYVRDAVNALAARKGGNSPRLSAEMRILSEPTSECDLTFYWRRFLDPGSRSLAPGAFELITDALATARDAFQGASATHLLLDLDLPLPLAFLVGYEWRITTRLRLTVNQRTGVSFTEVDSDGDVARAPEAVHERLGGDGPAVVAVSCLDGLGDPARRYASQVGARELVTLHIPGILDAAAIRSLARACARELRALNHRRIDKHLLMLGPAALAVFAGAAANACGSLRIPFWDGSNYVQPLTIKGEER